MDDERAAGDAPPDASSPGPGRLDPSVEGPLDRDTARAFLDRAAELLEAGDYAAAARFYQRVIGQPDAAITAAALLGLGQAFFRLDREDDALAAWTSIFGLAETPATYHAWREIAAARVREGDLSGAIEAYEKADRRAPPEDRAEIASRLGWLKKETGDTRAAGRYFARARAAGPALPLTWIIVGLTVVTSVVAWNVEGTQFDLYGLLQMDKVAVAAGEYWRLWTVTLLHAPLSFGLLHLLFNMYALWLTGPIAERLYGSRMFGVLWLLFAAGGSIASFLFGGAQYGVGASGAIFGVFGLLFAASRAHQPVLGRGDRRMLGSIGGVIALNLLFGLSAGGLIDNAAHVGGLLTGLWLGYLFVPGGVPTLASLWWRVSAGSSEGDERRQQRAQVVLRALGLIALLVVLFVGLVVGTDARRGGAGGNEAASPTVVAVIGPPSP